MACPGTERAPNERLAVRWLGRVPYDRALALQDETLRARLEDRIPDTLFLLEHEPVYTLGRGAREEDLLGAPARLGVPVFRVGRGGAATFHGPGQLVAYPIVALARQGRDVRRYVQALEEVAIRVCRGFGVEAFRRPGLVGVWSRGGKIASIGVGVRRWVAYHGLALNVETDLRFFEAIVPCALPGESVTSIARERGDRVGVEEAVPVLVREFCSVFGFEAPSEP
ncbi:MAG: octanoyltransferase [Candidatus Binatia bacterium]|nr:MAG: octanoyltransferase [Candidatus Binatia bacterium]